MKCIMFCHESKIFYEYENLVYESYRKDEEVLVNFINKIGFQLNKYDKVD